MQYFFCTIFLLVIQFLWLTYLYYCTNSFIQEVGWDEELVNKSFPWVEEKIVQWPKIAPWQAALRDGLLQAGVAPFNGYTYDHVSGTKVGGTIFDETGYRHTAADLLAAGDPNNLRVLLHASVHRIVFDSRQGNHWGHMHPTFLSCVVLQSSRVIEIQRIERLETAVNTYHSQKHHFWCRMPEAKGHWSPIHWWKWQAPPSISEQQKR